VLHDLQGLGSLTTIWYTFSDTWDRENSTLKMSIQTGGDEIVEELILIQGYGYIDVCAPLQLSHRGVGGVGLKGCWQRGGPESIRSPPRPTLRQRP
jgi:hypothetical protein